MTLKDLLTEDEYAALRGVSVRTIQRERALRAGPPFIKLGRSIFYRPEAVDAWIIAQEQTPTGSNRAA
jgi:predicted DNA-binding transcriptional regulator AlpA